MIEYGSRLEDGHKLNKNTLDVITACRMNLSKLPALVIAAREVAFGDQPPSRESIRILDKASEEFSEQVPWEDDPNDD
jgi:hypothetical protein